MSGMHRFNNLMVREKYDFQYGKWYIIWEEYIVVRETVKKWKKSGFDLG